MATDDAKTKETPKITPASPTSVTILKKGKRKKVNKDRIRNAIPLSFLPH
jgi:hypothetical protein